MALRPGHATWDHKALRSRALLLPCFLTHFVACHLQNTKDVAQEGCQSDRHTIVGALPDLPPIEQTVNPPEQPLSILDLPRTALGDIFQRLPGWHDTEFTWQHKHKLGVSYLSLVCTEWRNVADDIVEVLCIPKDVPIEEISRTLCRFPNLTSVVIDSCERVARASKPKVSLRQNDLKEVLELLSKHCPKLTRLHVNRDEGKYKHRRSPQGEQPESQKYFLPLLQSLTISWESSYEKNPHPYALSTVPESLYVACPNVTELTLERAGPVIGTSVVDLIMKCPSLVTLRLSVHETRGWTQNLFAKFWQEPPGLSLNHLDSEFVIPSTLRVIFLHSQSGAFVQTLLKVGLHRSKVEILGVSFPLKELGQPKPKLLLAENNCSCQTLTLLKLTRVEITDSDVEALANPLKFPDLRMVVLRCCGLFTHNLTYLVQGAERLETLVVHSSYRPSTEDLALVIFEAVIRGWARRQRRGEQELQLFVPWPPQIDDESMEAMQRRLAEVHIRLLTLQEYMDLIRQCG
eukprot:TRINITY_DN611_c0_g1_i2.p1 TRINITY_DN611_c0_g1~~TRINITY_DN611_c0_g1_i2.p1  ORF type:complete len:518 (-),score=19.54 TRINITY_DN611_c0_g1_i2:607-2160(-)